MSTKSLTAGEVRSVRVLLVGRVQGLGVRPALARLAKRFGLTGAATNTVHGVTLELEGETGAVDRYLAELVGDLPAGATLDRIQVESAQPIGRHEFRITAEDDVAGGSTAVPLDRVLCEVCLANIRQPTNRRQSYPFTSCTSCGPRYSIISAMPYDRPATSMRPFGMCPQCFAEYRTTEDRRFHAQTNACPQCGPQVRLTDPAGRTFVGDDAVNIAVTALGEGRIVALKGLGGYQLLVDATSTAAVRRLRDRKRRKTKALAILVGSIDEAKRLAFMNDAERRLLLDPAGPIVVLRRRAHAPISADVAPEFDSVGLLLPTTPLHFLLSDRIARPLVCTSGNREGEPLVYEERRAELELCGVADLWLHHDRSIARPIDDTVVRVINGAPCFLRLARGYAPHVLPRLPRSLDVPIIALGGEQKSSIALWNSSQAVLSPHIGDLTDAVTCERWVEQVEALSALYGIRLDSALMVHDRHPDYFSSGWARRYNRRQVVQHHHAHIAAVLFEHGDLDREVVGLAWDGSGYGDDATVWGGECLQATCRDFQRTAWLRPFSLLGSDQAVRQPWRNAVALVNEALGPEAAARLSWSDVCSTRVRALVDLAARPSLSPRTSSMGRLFDAVAALALGVATADDDGRPAMLLEQACNRNTGGEYLFDYAAGGNVIDWRPVIAAVVDDLQQGATPGAVAMRFHRAVADLASSLAAAHDDLPLVTSGGVFQNAVLGELMAERIADRRAGWLRPLVVPPGDGGLAAGQLAVVAARLLSTKREG